MIELVTRLAAEPAVLSTTLSVLPGSLDGGNLALTGGAGAGVGGITGYAVKKVAKVIAILFGAQAAFLAYLQRQGIVSVDWTAFSQLAEKNTTTAVDATNSLVSTAAGTGALGAGFTGGFAFGFHRG